MKQEMMAWQWHQLDYANQHLITEIALKVISNGFSQN